MGDSDGVVSRATRGRAGGEAVEGGRMMSLRPAIGETRRDVGTNRDGVLLRWKGERMGESLADRYGSQSR